MLTLIGSSTRAAYGTARNAFLTATMKILTACLLMRVASRKEASADLEVALRQQQKMRRARWLTAKVAAQFVGERELIQRYDISNFVAHFSAQRRKCEQVDSRLRHPTRGHSACCAFQETLGGDRGDKGYLCLPGATRRCAEPIYITSRS